MDADPAGAPATPLPAWAAWSPDAARRPWTVGVEEEAMLVDPRTGALAPRIGEVLHALPDRLRSRAASETHAAVVELATAPAATVAEAIADLRDLRRRLAGALAPLGLCAAVAGTHPFAQPDDAEVAPGRRHRAVEDSMQELARREPTFALHVHVAIPDPETAVRTLDGLRAHLPVLLALSANSPFWRGRDSGLDSARTPIFGAFPRVGIPRRFGAYDDYVEAVDLLLRCGAVPEPTFIWWDARLQPKYGTIEVRAMDAQTTLADTAALVALVQALVRHLATRDVPGGPDHPEALDENRFLAARDGMAAQLIDVRGVRRVPVARLAGELLDACGADARALRCAGELEDVRRLARAPGAARQRAVVDPPPPGRPLAQDALRAVVAALADGYLAG